MRIFLTGATGFIGSAIVRELIEAGHRVVGLARSEGSAAKLTAVGAEVHQGELTDHASLVAGAKDCEGVIHTAFIHDFAKYEDNARIDREAIRAIASALEGSNKPFVTTSGTALVAPGIIGTEADPAVHKSAAGIRAAAEEIMLEAAGRGVRTSFIRLPPSVHDKGDVGFIPTLIDIARREEISCFIGEGSNRWPAVHRLDAARLFRLALENAAPGTRLHGVAEQGIPMRQIAETIGTGLGVAVRSLQPEEAVAHFDWIAAFVALDNPMSSGITRETMGWHPVETDLLTDMRGYMS